MDFWSVLFRREEPKKEAERSEERAQPQAWVFPFPGPEHWQRAPARARAPVERTSRGAGWRMVGGARHNEDLIGYLRAPASRPDIERAAERGLEEVDQPLPAPLRESRLGALIPAPPRDIPDYYEPPDPAPFPWGPNMEAYRREHYDREVPRITLEEASLWAPRPTSEELRDNRVVATEGRAGFAPASAPDDAPPPQDFMDEWRTLQERSKNLIPSWETERFIEETNPAWARYWMMRRDPEDER